MLNKSIEIILCASPSLLMFFHGLELFSQPQIITLLVLLFFALAFYMFRFRYRWQLLPCCVAYALTVIAIFAQSLGLGQILIVFSTVLLSLLSLVLLIGLPIPKLPAAGGSHGVGTVDTVLLDKQRYKNLASTDGAREIAIKIWYPVDKDKIGKPETFWSALITDDETPKLMRVLLKYLHNVLTHSYQNAQFNSALANVPVILYCPGMVSFTAENTLLMEHLASQGFVVVSVCHRDQLAEFKALTRIQIRAQKEAGDKLLQTLKQCQDPVQRGKLSRQLYAVSDVTNQVVNGRVKDLHCVVENIDSILSNIPQAMQSCFNLQKMGLLGYSLGGAVITEFSKQSSAVAVINIDGGLFGAHREDPILMPYLMIYSSANEGSNDELLMNAALLDRVVINDVTHMDLHDASYIYPILRWLRVTSKRSKIEIIAERNQLVAEFLQTKTLDNIIG